MFGFNHSSTSRFPNLMRPFQIQSLFLNFMTHTFHGNRSNFLNNFWKILEYSKYILLYLTIFLNLVYKVCYFYLLFVFRSPNLRSSFTAYIGVSSPSAQCLYVVDSGTLQSNQIVGLQCAWYNYGYQPIDSTKFKLHHLCDQKNHDM